MARDEDDKGKKMTPTEKAIVDMMKKQNLIQLQQASAQDGDGEKKHTFWDTQVRRY